MSNKNNNQQKRNKKSKQKLFTRKEKERIEWLHLLHGKSSTSFQLWKKNIFLINYIKGEFAYGNNIVELIRNGKYIDTSMWYPNLDINMETDPDKKGKRYRNTNEI